MAYRTRMSKSYFYRMITEGIKTMVIAIILASIVAGLLIRFVGERIEVKGQSMEPVLFEGESLILDKITYRMRSPKRYDIIVLNNSLENNRPLVKRLIGLPGDTVAIRDGQVYVNGKMIPKKYAHGQKTSGIDWAKDDTVTLRNGCYFVLGDNRSVSKDSRSFDVRFITKDEIQGRVLLRILPIKKAGKVS